MSAGEYSVNLTTVPDENHTEFKKTVSIVINKAAVNITADKITTVYAVSQWMYVTLTSNGTPVAGKTVTIVINNVKYTQTTNSNGRLRIATPKALAVSSKAYDANISFAGDDNYTAATALSSVLVKKATPKLTAKAKAYRVSVRTKLYSIALKTHKNTVMKNKKVALKVNGKKFYAKTNSKGIATFKLTNLNKRAKYALIVRYAGDSCYTSVTVKTKIAVK